MLSRHFERIGVSVTGLKSLSAFGIAFLPNWYDFACLPDGGEIMDGG